MISNRKLARIAGLLYLITVAGNVFAEFFVRSKLIVPGNAAATAGNILASGFLFRLGIVSDIIGFLGYLFVAVVLYKLFKPVNQLVAFLCVLLISIVTAVLFLNILNLFSIVLILNSASIQAAFTADQINNLVLFFTDVHKYGYILGAVFYGGWFLPLGYHVFKSKYMPKIVGILLTASGFGFLADFLNNFLIPNSPEIISTIALVIAMIGEGLFFLWLLARGAKDNQGVVHG